MAFVAPFQFRNCGLSLHGSYLVLSMNRFLRFTFISVTFMPRVDVARIIHNPYTRCDSPSVSEYEHREVELLSPLTKNSKP